ncbi:hypothetical protein ACFL0Y_02970 [Patescibacteria group bacterium]
MTNKPKIAIFHCGFVYSGPEKILLHAANYVCTREERFSGQALGGLYGQR